MTLLRVHAFRIFTIIYCTIHYNVVLGVLLKGSYSQRPTINYHEEKRILVHANQQVCHLAPVQVVKLGELKFVNISKLDIQRYQKHEKFTKTHRTAA